MCLHVESDLHRSQLQNRAECIAKWEAVLARATRALCPKPVDPVQLAQVQHQYYLLGLDSPLTSVNVARWRGRAASAA